MFCRFAFFSYFFNFIFFLFFFFYISIFRNELLLQIKTVQLNMYAEYGQLHASNNDLLSLEGRISLVVNSENAWYGNNRIIANPSKHQEMLLDAKH